MLRLAAYFGLDEVALNTRHYCNLAQLIFCRQEKAPVGAQGRDMQRAFYLFRLDACLVIIASRL
jgi:hypothetical protein